jgi:hypothetical protein
VATKLGGAQDSVVGRTVGEVVTSAQAWRSEQEEKSAEARKRQAEAEMLKSKVEAERKDEAEKIATAVTGKRILPEDMDDCSYEDQSLIQYAVANRGTKDIRLLKGKMYFLDAAGDEVGVLPLSFDPKIGAGQTLKTDTGYIWKLRSYGPA